MRFSCYELLLPLQNYLMFTFTKNVPTGSRNALLKSRKNASKFSMMNKVPREKKL